MLLKICEKILLYGNNVILFILLYLLYIMWYGYPDCTIDIGIMTIIELSQWFSNMYIK